MEKNIEVESRYLVPATFLGTDTDIRKVMGGGWQELPVQTFASCLLDTAEWSLQKSGANLRVRLLDVSLDAIKALLDSAEADRWEFLAAYHDSDLEPMLKVVGKVGGMFGRTEIDDPRLIGEYVFRNAAKHPVVTDKKALMQILCETGFAIFNVIFTTRRLFKKHVTGVGAMSVAWDETACIHCLMDNEKKRRIVEVETLVTVPSGVMSNRIIGKQTELAETQNKQWVANSAISSWYQVPGSAALCILAHMPIADVAQIYQERRVVNPVGLAYRAGEISVQRIKEFVSRGILSHDQFFSVKSSKQR